MPPLHKIKQAVTKQPSKDESLFPVIKVAYMTRLGDATICENYGIHGNPPVETPCLMVTVNGDESNRYVIPLSAHLRTKGLKEGEFETGNFLVGSILRFLENGDVILDAIKDVEINAPNGMVTVNSPLITLNGNVIITKNLEVLDEDMETSIFHFEVENKVKIFGQGEMLSQTIVARTHIHSDVEPGTGTTGPPVP